MMEEHHRQAIQTQPPPRVGHALLDGCRRPVWISGLLRGQRPDLGHHHDLVGHAQVLQRPAEDFLALAIRGRRVEAVHPAVESRAHHRPHFRVVGLPGAVGDAVGHAELGGAQHQARQMSLVPR
jgi:hypothetical protein